MLNGYIKRKRIENKNKKIKFEKLMNRRQKRGVRRQRILLSKIN